MSKLSNNVIAQIQSLQLGLGVSFVQMYDAVNGKAEFSLPHHSVKTWSESHEFIEFSHAFHFKTKQQSVFILAPKLAVDQNGFDCGYSHIYAQNLVSGEWTDLTETRWSGLAHSTKRNKFCEIENIFLNTKRTLSDYGIDLPDTYAMVIFLSVFGEINKDLITVNKDHLVFSISPFNLLPYVIGQHQSHKSELSKIELSPRFAVSLESAMPETENNIIYQDENIVMVETIKENYGHKVLTGIYRSNDSFYECPFVYLADPKTCKLYHDEFTLSSDPEKLKFFNSFIRDIFIETRLMDYSNTKGELEKVTFKQEVLVAFAQYIGLDYQVHELNLPTEIMENIKKHGAFDDTLSVNKLITDQNFYNIEIFKDRMNWLISLTYIIQVSKSKTVREGHDYFHTKLAKNPQKTKFNDEFYSELLEVA